MLVLVGVGAGGEVGLTLAGQQVRPSGQLLFEYIRMLLRDCIQGPMAAISCVSIICSSACDCSYVNSNSP
jgi:hypothetical protein